MIQSVIDSVSRGRLVQEGDTVVLRYSYASICLWVLGLVLLLVAAFFLWWKWKRREFAAGVLLVAAVMGAIAIPGVITSRIIIGKDYVIHPRGLWFNESIHRYAFSNGTKIVVSSRRVEGRVDRDVMVWTFHYPDQPEVSVEPAELWTANASLVADELKKRGVQVEGLKE
jgi:hypothetical protein